ncbi:MAG: UPF0079 ATP-binding protein [Parcubacteria group bacterium Athens0714_16]|nr:MAG: UPF0079 ATP-binding protein [Parcubacteria group bacterium Athens0714_16]
MEIISKNTEETRDIAKNFLQNLEQPNKKALVVGLHGNLGSGKTTFVQFVAEALGIKGNITSPTFVIEKIYPVKFRQRRTRFNGASKIENREWPKKLIHIDAYRLQKGEELRVLGFEEILNDSGNLVLIEWPENVLSALPKEILKMEFEFVDENTRRIQIIK